MSQASAHPKAKINESVSEFGANLAELKNNVKEKAEDAYDHGKQAVYGVSDAAHVAIDGLRDTTKHARKQIKKSMNERPLTTIAVAAVGGIALVSIAKMLWKHL